MRQFVHEYIKTNISRYLLLIHFPRCHFVPFNYCIALPIKLLAPLLSLLCSFSSWDIFLKPVITSFRFFFQLLILVSFHPRSSGYFSASIPMLVLLNSGAPNQVWITLRSAIKHFSLVKRIQLLGSWLTAEETSEVMLMLNLVWVYSLNTVNWCTILIWPRGMFLKIYFLRAERKLWKEHNRAGSTS